MGMDVDSGGGKGKVKPEMNVTPLVDVVLVLLIIFMVIAPVVTAGLEVKLPPKPDPDAKAIQRAQENKSLKVYVFDDGTYTINNDPAFTYYEEDLGKLSESVAKILKGRETDVVYVDAQDSAEFGLTIKLMTATKKGGANPIVFLADPLKVKTKPTPQN